MGPDMRTFTKKCQVAVLVPEFAKNSYETL